MKANTVYKFTPKGIRRTEADEDYRLFMVAPGKVCMYAGDEVICPYEYYKGVDSHIAEANEPMPATLKIDPMWAEGFTNTSFPELHDYPVKFEYVKGLGNL